MFIYCCTKARLLCRISSQTSSPHSFKLVVSTSTRLPTSIGITLGHGNLASHYSGTSFQEGGGEPSKQPQKEELLEVSLQCGGRLLKHAAGQVRRVSQALIVG